MSEANHIQPQPLSEDVYRLICEHCGVALIATDANLNIRMWNNAAGRIFGASAERMIGTPVLSVLPAEHRAVAESLLSHTIAGQELGEFEFSQRDDAGQRRHFAASVSPLVGPNDATLGASIWVRDITQRTHLAKEVAQGRKMFALGEMAGAIAHHFNNILGGLVTSVDFALAADDPDIEHRALAQTGQSLNRATRLVENLLAFAEGDRRTDDLADLTEILLSTLDTVEPQLAAAGVKLDLDLKPVPVAAVPRNQMTTAIFSFLHNAMEAMPDGGELRVELEHRDGCCILRFTDTGCGMDEENLDRIFEPFYSTKSGRSGAADRAAGLGLAVAHGIIHEIGGRISVSSQVGAGTSFAIRIPIRPAVLGRPAPDEDAQGPEIGGKMSPP